MVEVKGIGPSTSCLQSKRSPVELHPHFVIFRPITVKDYDKPLPYLPQLNATSIRHHHIFSVGWWTELFKRTDRVLEQANRFLR